MTAASKGRLERSRSHQANRVRHLQAQADRERVTDGYPLLLLLLPNGRPVREEKRGNDGEVEREKPIWNLGEEDENNILGDKKMLERDLETHLKGVLLFRKRREK